MNFMTFHSVGNVIIPTDELRFFRGETTNQSCSIKIEQLAFGKLTLDPENHPFVVETILPTPICQGLCEFTRGYPLVNPLVN